MLRQVSLEPDAVPTPGRPCDNPLNSACVCGYVSSTFLPQVDPVKHCTRERYSVFGQAAEAVTAVLAFSQRRSAVL
jgi:hypothetical protein